MRLSKFLFTMVIITTVSVVYIQQQTFLLKLSYEIKDKKGTLGELLDENKILMYKVLALKAPSNLEKTLTLKDVQLEMPQEWQVVSLSEMEAQEGLASGSSPSPSFNFSLNKPKAKNILLSIFNLKSQAEAEAQAVNSRELSQVTINH